MERLLALVILCFTGGLNWARKVSVPPGPLVRVEGQTLSLRCEVSDYEGPPEQDFDWKATRGSETINVISTFDSSFPDQSLKDRVISEDIRVQRLGDSTVELRIRESKVTDSATYTCSTPSTDSVISGNYHANVQLTVIADMLVLVPEAPVSSVTEGRSISLRCNISYDFVEGIYLSVTYSIKKEHSLEEDIFTFGPDVGVTVGLNFTRRYADGGMHLHMDSGGSYSLVLSGAVPADEGMYVCAARQWTREQGVWNRIQEKTAVMGQVAVVPTAESLTVQVLGNTFLTIGDTLNLTCLVSADDYAVLGLEVTWLLNATQVLTHLGRDGIVEKTSNVLSLTQVGEGVFRLEIQRIELTDMGFYSCRVRAWVQHSKGKWYQAAEKRSTPVEVLVNPKDPAFTVALDSPVVAQYLGEPTELVCKVTNISLFRWERLGVSWFYSVASPSNDQRTTDIIASLNENGALVPSEKYRSRIASGHIVVTQMEPATFKLHLLHTANTDAGEYACSVMTWAPTRHGNWKKSSEHRSHALTVRLASKGPGVSVAARIVRPATSTGSTFEMACQARLKNLQAGISLSVLILVQESIGAPNRKLASLNPDLILKLEDWLESSRKDSLSLLKSGREEFRFRIQGVQLTDKGFYSCEVGVWTRQDRNEWAEVAKADSNKVLLTFDHTRPSFELSISSDTSSIYPWETVKMECIVSVSGTSPNTDDVAYEIRWYLSPLRGSDSLTLLASMDRWGMVKKSPRNDSSDCSLERLRAQRFTLNIHGTQDSDAGEYYCTATPWIRSGISGVWSKEPDLISKRVFLNVKFALWDSIKLPLLYGTCASLSVGLFSLILGFVCARCCCRNTTHTPRSRIKLMDLEID
ncbi:prostaglandin F2 receptor negative regulator isoform X1 [Pygocentrus nattereri]|uniref:prostaglandin F2 receptor negative regulator isoform X1 n=1 Tax=Pygocentrus nattereri TaxID=42514 RepID=UPI0008142336|nr:prostaglandin F2 receptor negative regulator isoform X1 [Pygocentrus nattereri]